MYVARTAAILTITVTDPTAGTSTSTKVAATVGAPFITELSVADGGEAGASLTGSQAIAAGSDGNLWFTYNGNTNIDRMTPSGVVTQFALPPGDGASAITSGRNASRWAALAPRLKSRQRDRDVDEQHILADPRGRALNITLDDSPSLRMRHRSRVRLTFSWGSLALRASVFRDQRDAAGARSGR